MIVQNAIKLVQATKNIALFNNPTSKYHTTAKAIIDQLESNSDLVGDNSITDHLRRKMQWYMAEYVYVCMNYARLVDYQPKSNETQSFYLIGILIGICDFLIDDSGEDTNRIFQLISPDKLQPTNDLEKLYKASFDKFRAQIPSDSRQITKYYQRLFEAQIESRKQLNTTLGFEEVDAICKEKCGANMLLLRALIPSPCLDGEEEAWYELGGFVQYCNDVQDIIKDTRNGILSFANVRMNYETIIEDLEQQRCVAYKKIKSLDYPQSRKDDMLFSLFVMYVVILSKVRRLARATNVKLNQELLTSEKMQFINLTTITWRQIGFVLPAVLRYSYKKAEQKIFGFREVMK